MASPTFKMLDISQINIRPNRQRAELADIDMLAASIQANGLIHPILVEQDEDGSYFLVAGERRTTAGKMLGWKKIPV